MSPSHDDSSEPSLGDAACIALQKATRGDLAGLHPEYVVGPGRRLDLRVRLKVEGQLVDFAIELLGHAYPRDIAGAIAWLKAMAPDGDIPVIPMIAAEELSPGAKELLRQEDVAHFDRQGTLYLRWRHWIIDIRQVDAKSATKPKHGGLNLFTGARAGVVLAILHFHGKWMQVTELADLAQTTGFTCSKVLQELDALGWCESEGSGRTRRRRLIKPNALFDAWAQAWPPKKEKRSHWYCFAPPGGLQKRLSDALRKAPPSITWAFTGAAPANIHAPTLTAVSDAEIIVPPGQAARFADRLGLEPADKGFNVTVIERDASSLLFRQNDTDGLWAASPFILYLDLLNGRGRNKELAANVRATMGLGRDGIGE